MIGVGVTVFRFQSTHPVWGGTSYGTLRGANFTFQSTHPVWGGTHAGLLQSLYLLPISIHPPRVGWDARADFKRQAKKNFNPPTPCGVGRIFYDYRRCWLYFNPPTPCGVGRLAFCHFLGHQTFQSTHPVWGGTLSWAPQTDFVYISIHPPRVGWDTFSQFCYCCLSYFNPPTPCGVGRGLSQVPKVDNHFNPPTPCGVGQQKFTKQAVELLRK